MEINGCAYCDSKQELLTPIEYHGVEFRLCDECLLFLLRTVNADNYFSPASCSFS